MELLLNFLGEYFKELYRVIAAGDIADIIFLGIVFFVVLTRIWAGNERDRRLRELAGVAGENLRLRKRVEQANALLRQGDSFRNDSTRELEDLVFAAEKRALAAEIEAKTARLEMERMRNPRKAGGE